MKAFLMVCSRGHHFFFFFFSDSGKILSFLFLRLGDAEAFPLPLSVLSLQILIVSLSVSASKSGPDRRVPGLRRETLRLRYLAVHQPRRGHTGDSGHARLRW